MVELSDPVLTAGVGPRLGLLLAKSYTEPGVKVIGTERPELDLLRRQDVDL